MQGYFSGPANSRAELEGKSNREKPTASPFAECGIKKQAVSN
jgi:hypothetical protein